MFYYYLKFGASKNNNFVWIRRINVSFVYVAVFEAVLLNFFWIAFFLFCIHNIGKCPIFLCLLQLKCQWKSITQTKLVMKLSRKSFQTEIFKSLFLMLDHTTVISFIYFLAYIFISTLTLILTLILPLIILTKLKTNIHFPLCLEFHFLFVANQ